VCTLAIYRDVSTAYPLVVAANRDEFHARPTRAPGMLVEPSGVVAGIDLEAGGTWLGCRVAASPLVAGLLNRRSVDPAVPLPTGERSRGLLCLDALRSPSATEAARCLSEDAVGRSGPFNLLVADRDAAFVFDNEHGLRRTPLEPGLSVLTNLSVNDPRCPRLASAVPGFECAGRTLAANPALPAVVEALREALSDHRNSLDPADQNPFARVCIHGSAYGTRSSTIIVVDDRSRVHYFHADGAPCTTALERVRYD